MFNIDNAIVKWKQELNYKNSLTDSDIDELETHLLDEIESLSNNGLTSEESFFIAIKRIGSVELIDNKFGKINTTSMFFDKIFWFLIGYCIIAIIQTTMSLIYRNLVNSFNMAHLYLRPIGFPISIILVIVIMYFLMYKFNTLFTIKPKHKNVLSGVMLIFLVVIYYLNQVFY